MLILRNFTNYIQFLGYILAEPNLTPSVASEFAKKFKQLCAREKNQPNPKKNQNKLKKYSLITKYILHPDYMFF